MIGNSLAKIRSFDQLSQAPREIYDVLPVVCHLFASAATPVGGSSLFTFYPPILYVLLSDVDAWRQEIFFSEQTVCCSDGSPSVCFGCHSCCWFFTVYFLPHVLYVVLSDVDAWRQEIFLSEWTVCCSDDSPRHVASSGPSQPATLGVSVLCLVDPSEHIETRLPNMLMLHIPSIECVLPCKQHRCTVL